MDILYFILLVVTYSEMCSGRPMRSPDFVSDWLYLSVHKGKDLLKVPHGLGEVPVLVQVQAKPPSGYNKDFVFNGIGEIPRDDDANEPYGAVSYLYDKEFVVVTTMSFGNNYPGKAILTMNNRYFVGPNSQTSDDCYVQILAWKQTSLPEPDFYVGNISVQSGCTNVEECFVEVNHDFGTYPSLVVVRTRLDDFRLTNHSLMSDSIGSGFIMYNGESDQGILIYGFNQTTFRIWTEIKKFEYHHLFCASDGTGFGICVQNGALEILAWKESTLAPTEKIKLLLGTDADERFDQEKLMSVETIGRHYFVQLWAAARNGPNVQYRFLASGSMASTADPQMLPCTFGGLEFAYSNTTIRLWKPNSSFNRASIICVPNIFAGGKYSQSSNDAFAVAHVWITVDHNLHAECNTTHDCLDENSACSSNFTCQCKSGFSEIQQEENITVTGCLLEGQCRETNDTKGDCIGCRIIHDLCTWSEVEPQPNGPNTTALVAGFLSLGLLIILTVLLVVYLYRRNRQRKEDIRRADTMTLNNLGYEASTVCRE